VFRARISYNVWWKDALSDARLEMQGHISHGLNTLLDMSWASKPDMMVALARAFVGCAPRGGKTKRRFMFAIGMQFQNR